MDIVDRANAVAETAAQDAIHAARVQAAEIPKGKPGDCDLCGEWTGRLVVGVCAPCRDARGL